MILKIKYSAVGLCEGMCSYFYQKVAPMGALYGMR